MSDSRLGKGLQALIRSKEDQIKDNLENYKYPIKIQKAQLLSKAELYGCYA